MGRSGRVTWRSVKTNGQPVALTQEDRTKRGDRSGFRGRQRELRRTAGRRTAGLVFRLSVLVLSRVAKVVEANHPRDLQAHPGRGDAAEQALQHEHVEHEHAEGGPPCS
jgi:hypothetical protein